MALTAQTTLILDGFKSDELNNLFGKETEIVNGSNSVFESQGINTTTEYKVDAVRIDATNGRVEVDVSGEAKLSEAGQRGAQVISAITAIATVLLVFAFVGAFVAGGWVGTAIALLAALSVGAMQGIVTYDSLTQEYSQVPLPTDSAMREALLDAFEEQYTSGCVANGGNLLDCQNEASGFRTQLNNKINDLIANQQPTWLDKVGGAVNNGLNFVVGTAGDLLKGLAFALIAGGAIILFSGIKKEKSQRGIKK